MNKEFQKTRVPQIGLPSSGGKRRPSERPVNSSDEDEGIEVDIPSLPTSPSAAGSSTEYSSPPSPNSSTASGPIYIRPAGFLHHGQEIICRSKLKKKKTFVPERDALKRRDQTPPKARSRREPLPMRLRALPQSFWEQPNKPQTHSPASMYPILPPLAKDNDVTDIRPITPPEEREKKKTQPQKPERKLTTANTDLLFKLFDHVERDTKDKDKKSSVLSTQSSLKARGRPRKFIQQSSLVLGDDPYLVDAVTEKLFPQLSIENSKLQNGGAGQSLTVVTLREGERSINLPSLTVEQNYSQMLSELVMHI